MVAIFLRYQSPFFLFVSIDALVVSIVVLLVSTFPSDSPLFLLTHDEQDEIENITTAASVQILNKFFIILMFKFCIYTAKSGKVTRQKNIKKGNLKTGYLLQLNRINNLNTTAFWSYPF